MPPGVCLQGFASGGLRNFFTKKFLKNLQKTLCLGAGLCPPAAGRLGRRSAPASGSKLPSAGTLCLLVFLWKTGRAIRGANVYSTHF